MMKLSLILGAFLFLSTAMAAPVGGYGDEDGPFPLACINFRGNWKSDAGAKYAITQRRCNMLKIKATMGSTASSTTIVPDNKSRNVSGSEWTGQVRHRWNSIDYGTGIETYRTMFFDDQKVSEVIIIELVNSELLLESVYRTIEPKVGKKRQEVVQHVFRLMDAN